MSTTRVSGGSQTWSEQALKHAPQLFIYGHALRAAGHSVLAYLVHFTVGGGIVELAGAIQTNATQFPVTP